MPKGETKENGIRLVERKETLGDVTHRILTVPIAQDQLAMYYQQRANSWRHGLCRRDTTS